jgi:hypothetical protein
MLDHDPLTSPDVEAFDLSGSVGRYTLTWPDLQIGAMVSEFDSRHGDLTAIVEFTSQRPSAPDDGHVVRRRVNLDNPSSQYIKLLESQDASINWFRIIEQLTASVVREHKRGVPEVEIAGQFTAEPEGRWLVKPLIQIGHPTLMYGAGSSGKSWLAQWIGVLVHEGISVPGIEVESRGNVLYLDWETDVFEIGSRFAMVRRGMGLPDNPSSGIWYKYMTQGLAADISAVRAVVQERNINFIILDSLGAACMGEPESADVVLKLFGALRSLGVTSLCIDHTNKKSTGTDALFGSVYKYNNSRQVFLVDKSQREGDTSLHLAMSHQKANNTRIIRPMGWEMSFDNVEASMTLRSREVKDTRLANKMSTADQIEVFLLEQGNKPQSIKDIADGLDKTNGHISVVMSDNKDRFWSPSRGMYQKIMTAEETMAYNSVDIPPAGASEWEA